MKRVFLVILALFLAVLACEMPDITISAPTGAPVQDNQSDADQVSDDPTPEPTGFLLPAGVIVAQNEDTPNAQQLDNVIVFVDPNGAALAQTTTPGLDYAQPENTHAAGRFSGG